MKIAPRKFGEMPSVPAIRPGTSKYSTENFLVGSSPMPPSGRKNAARPNTASVVPSRAIARATNSRRRSAGSARATSSAITARYV